MLTRGISSLLVNLLLFALAVFLLALPSGLSIGEPSFNPIFLFFSEVWLLRFLRPVAGEFTEDGFLTDFLNFADVTSLGGSPRP